jgi:hypothetical protein
MVPVRKNKLTAILAVPIQAMCKVVRWIIWLVVTILI